MIVAFGLFCFGCYNGIIKKDYAQGCFDLLISHLLFKHYKEL